jgi:plastocyanin
MKFRNTMLLMLTVSSLAFIALLATSNPGHIHQALAYPATQKQDHIMADKKISDMNMADHMMMQASQDQDQENTPITKTSDGIKIDFTAQKIIHASDLASLEMKISDEKSASKLSHVDWAIVVKGPNGEIIYKTTTAHTHVGVMDLKVAFPTAGTSTVYLTTSSIGQKMSGMEVEPAGRTHIMVSGSPKGFKTDPENDFGSRTFEFPVYVQPLSQTHTISGTEPNTSVNVALSSTENNIIVGHPTTLVFTITKAQDNSMITHPDLQVTVKEANYTYSQSAPVEGALTMNGAIHGHTGVMTLTNIFPNAGHYTIDVDLQPSPRSNYMWGKAHTMFDVVVSPPTQVSKQESAKQTPNTVNIVGLEAPFFAPNELKVKAGTTVTFVNTDGNTHTVTSVKPNTSDPDGAFDSGMLSSQKMFSFKFVKPGTYSYVCLIHPHMKGTVRVS